MIQRYKSPLIGGGIGLILALLLVSLGFFKTLFILILMAIGAGIGWYLQETGILYSLVHRLK